MKSLKSFVAGGLLLASIYGVAGCNNNASAEGVSQSSCPALLLKEASDFSGLSYQSGNYTVEVSNAKYDDFGYFKGDLIISEASGRKVLFQGDLILSHDPEDLADYVNNHLFAGTNRYFDRESKALETLLSPVSEKYKSLTQRVKSE